MQTIEIYDIEITKYSFVYTGFDIKTETYKTYVISIFKDERIKLKQHLENLINTNSFQCGFNNLDYDYPLIHFFIKLSNLKNFNNMEVNILLEKLNKKNNQLIPNDNEKKINKFGKNYNIISNPLINQIDIYKILHWDNASKRTSLKRAEINMRFKNVEEFDWDIEEYTEEIEKKLIKYNINDVEATKELYYLIRGRLDKITVNFPGMKENYNEDRLEFRMHLSKIYKTNMLNFNDVKIGEEIGKLTYLKESGKAWEEIKNKKTFIDNLVLKNLVPEYFRKNIKDNELIQLLNIIDNKVININDELENNKKAFNYIFNYSDLIWSFGLGGIHSQDKSEIIKTNEEYEMSELDGGSQYPSAIIALQIFPRHLDYSWNKACQLIKQERIIKKKEGKNGNTKAKMEAESLKLALNGGFYGKLGDKYNYQFDPLVKYSVTIKCQLDILLYTQMLKEKIPDIKLISANTDGIVAIYNKKYISIIDEINEEWKNITGIEMEKTVYKKIIRRDVNNYIAIKSNNDIKYKGIFDMTPELHKDSSFFIINKALKNYFVDNIQVKETIKNCNNIYDFLGSIRVQNTKQGKWSLYHLYTENKKEIRKKLQKINRYYVCNDKNSNILKVLNNWEKYVMIQSGYSVKPLNYIEQEDIKYYDINYNFYINEIEKIIRKIKIENTKTLF